LQDRFFGLKNILYLKQLALKYADKHEMLDPSISNMKLKELLRDVMSEARGAYAQDRMLQITTIMPDDMPVNTISGGVIHPSQIPTLKTLNKMAFKEIRSHMWTENHAQNYSNLLWLSRNPSAFVIPRPVRIESSRILQDYMVNEATNRFLGC